MDSYAEGPVRVLILGGSSEATALAHLLAHRGGVAAVLSLAGRTAVPAPQPIAVRVGGFGGIDGLVAYIEAEHIDVLVDALHPFAAQMAAHAEAAARRAGCRLVRLTRSPWRPGPGDRWQEVADMPAAAAALGECPRRVFLTVGRLQLAAFAAAPQHDYFVRTIEPVCGDHGFLRARFIEARGPFDVGHEFALMRDHRIEALVTKNSGGEASRAKLDAARALGLPVVLVRPPARTGTVAGIDDAVAAIEAHRSASPRGV